MSDISKVKVFENRFPVAKKVIWNDAVKKVNFDVDNDAFYALKEETDVNEERVTIIGLTNYKTPSIKVAYDSVFSEFPMIESMYLYISKIKGSHCFDRHNDPEAVLLVQCIGSMSYEFDDGSTRTINPGDALYIPSEVYHNPTVNTPRVTMSFGLPVDYQMEQ